MLREATFRSANAPVTSATDLDESIDERYLSPTLDIGHDEGLWRRVIITALGDRRGSLHGEFSGARARRRLPLGMEEIVMQWRDIRPGGHKRLLAGMGGNRRLDALRWRSRGAGSRPVVSGRVPTGSRSGAEPCLPSSHHQPPPPVARHPL
jgi:hypothetical protein